MDSVRANKFHRVQGLANRNLNSFSSQARPLPNTRHGIRSAVTGIKLKAASQLAPLSVQSTICFDTSARFFLVNDTLGFYNSQPILAADGNLLVSGEAVVQKPPYTKSFGFLMKCKVDGTVLWTKLYDSANHVSTNYLNYYGILELSNGDLLLAGAIWNEANHNDDLILTRTDRSGTIIWSQTYRSRFWRYGNGSADYYYVQQMKADPFENAVYLCGPLWENGRTLIKLNPGNGTILWSTAYEAHSLFDNPFGMDIRRNEIRYFGSTHDTYSVRVNVYRINKSNGKLLQEKNFRSDYGQQYSADFLTEEPLVMLQNGNAALAGECYGRSKYPWDGKEPFQQAAVWELDSNLNFVRAFCFRNIIPNNSYNTRITVFPDGTGIFTMLKVWSGYTADSYHIQFRNGQIIRQRRRRYSGEGLPNEQLAIRMPDGGDLSIKIVGDSASNGAKVEFLKLHPSDTASACLGYNDGQTFVEPYTFSEFHSNFVDSVAYNVFETTPNQTLTIQQVAATREPGCFQVSHCDSFTISASDSVLCLSKTLQLMVRKNAGCGSLIPLTYDTTAVDTLIRLSDSTLSMRFKKPWTGHISASLQGCTLMRDSIPIRVLDVPGSLDLGPDTTLCPDNVLTLNAHDGFATYRWQDGSTDSLFKVTQPGTYFLKAKDACGSFFYDTVHVTARPQAPISIGRDRQKCNSDTVHLEAPSGFINYSWSPNYNISGTATKQVVVNPLVDTFYIVKAEKTPGCFAFDTVRVTVKKSPAIRLGRDTSFCAGQQVGLDAGPGFAQYAWNTGDTLQQIIIDRQGQYIIKATTADGCISADTLQVQTIFARPQPRLQQTNSLCIGTTRMLDAGVFAQYHWQDGSTGQKFRASGLGEYFVEVTDDNGCTGSDTTVISKWWPLPVKFLPTDTAICSYGTLELSPAQAFETYAWSTASTQQKITITQPGLYMLRVTDSNHCAGIDSVMVYDKQCLKGLYVPTAFSPNGDGKNDELKGMLFGNIKTFEFTIYNRWGQVVFRTKNVKKGWDGAIRSTKQDTNVFVWTCRYQLSGEPERFEKGTVTLIR